MWLHEATGELKEVPCASMNDVTAQAKSGMNLSWLLPLRPLGLRMTFERMWGDAIAVPHAKGSLEVLPTGVDWKGLRVLAFAGIGRPEKFFATLRSVGAEVVRAEALDDHQPLGDALIARLERDARSLSAQLVTTEKDAVRLPSTSRQGVLTLPVRLAMNDKAALDAALDGLQAAQPFEPEVASS